MDVEHFRNLVLLDTQHAEERLINSWYPKLISMFSGDEKIVENIPFDRADSFHECVSTLLGNQMRLLLIVQHLCHPFMLFLSYIIHSSIISMFVHSFIHPSIHPFSLDPLYNHAFIHPLIHHLSIDSFLHPSIHPSIFQISYYIYLLILHLFYHRSLVTRTLEAFVSLFHISNSARLPIFRLELCLEDGEIFFFPSVLDLEAAMQFVVETITGALQNVGKIQVHTFYILYNTYIIGMLLHSLCI